MIIKTREPLLSPKHAAVRLNLSVRRIEQLSDEGQLSPIIDSSGNRTFRVEDLDALAKRRQVVK